MENENEEMNDMDYDADMEYDRMRDDNTDTMLEEVTQVIQKLEKLPYYRINKQRIAKDIIWATLDKMKMKIEVREINGHQFVEAKEI